MESPLEKVETRKLSRKTAWFLAAFLSSLCSADKGSSLLISYAAEAKAPKACFRVRKVCPTFYFPVFKNTHFVLS